MSDLILLKSVEPVINGVLKLEWRDGFEAVVDVRSLIGDGEMFQFLRDDPKRFHTVALGEMGHAIFWLDELGDEIGLSSNSLRDLAERQAAILQLAS
jgi:hypothetical protein